jgi:cation-transporting ATPase E
MTATGQDTGELGAQVGGLTETEAADRLARGLGNASGERTSRSLTQIVRANVLTRFNALLGVLLVLVLATGSWQDAAFGVVLVVNAGIGIVQEVRAKRSLDRLAVLSAPRARVLRDGRVRPIGLAEVVLDDVLELSAGDQVPADADVLDSDGLEVDESLLTGESDPVAKRPGDGVLSGGVVVAGRGLARATAVGPHSYARRIAADARRFTVTHSELQAGINRLLGWISWVLVVVGPILLISQLRSNLGWRTAVTGTAAGLVGMVPEGLVLLTSVAFAVATLTLARRGVLVQELPAVEGLARIDTLCLDKTGTLTQGRLVFGGTEPVGARPGPDDPQGPDDPPGPDGREALDGDGVVAAVLGALAARPDPNATLLALREAFPTPNGWDAVHAVAFSSARKWSSVTFAGRGTWVLGAPDVLVVGDGDRPVLQRAEELAGQGRRVLVLARADTTPADPAPTGAMTAGAPVLPPAVRPVVLLLFDERVRPDAAQTLEYFTRQQIAIKVISGDSPRTLRAVATRVGVPGADRVVDARELPTDPEALADAVTGNSVFGRVTPQQKRAMVRALRSRGHVVAMTGDGVNDALALKEADIGVAMGSGAPATRAVAQLVLVENRFDRLPAVVAEGRRVMANIERVAGLFVVKNVYSAVLSLAVAVAALPYPFLPRQLTVISTLTIGLPSFVLAFAADPQRFRPGFLGRVLRFSVPAGVLVGAGSFASYWLARALLSLPEDQARTAASITVLVAGLWILVLLSRPVVAWKLALVAAMGGVFVVALVVPVTRDFLQLAVPLDGLAEAVGIGVAVAAAVTAVRRRAGGGPAAG